MKLSPSICCLLSAHSIPPHPAVPHNYFVECEWGERPGIMHCWFSSPARWFTPFLELLSVYVLLFCDNQRSTHFYNGIKLKLCTTWIKNCTKQNLSNFLLRSIFLFTKCDCTCKLYLTSLLFWLHISKICFQLT